MHKGSFEVPIRRRSRHARVRRRMTRWQPHRQHRRRALALLGAVVRAAGGRLPVGPFDEVRVRVPADQVDVIMGCVMQVGAQSLNVGR